MHSYPRQITDAAAREMIDVKPFGFGSSRTVYSVPGDPLVIVKEMNEPFPASNMLEWFIWNWASAQPDNKLASIIGECLAISETGKYLIMERLSDIEECDYADVPDVPAWFNDTKPSAFGKVNGKIKIRDYGMTHADLVLSSEFVQPPAFAMLERVAKKLNYRS